jgi:hypothetical protein
MRVDFLLNVYSGRVKCKYTTIIKVWRAVDRGVGRLLWFFICGASVRDRGLACGMLWLGCRKQVEWLGLTSKLRWLDTEQLFIGQGLRLAIRAV